MEAQFEYITTLAAKYHELNSDKDKLYRALNELDEEALKAILEYYGDKDAGFLLAQGDNQTPLCALCLCHPLWFFQKHCLHDPHRPQTTPARYIFFHSSNNDRLF